MTARRSLLVLAALAAVTGCTRRSVPGQSGDALTVKGSDTMVILGQRWAEDYMATHPGTDVEVSGGGSGTGIAALINGSADVCQSSRAMTERESTALLEKRGQPPTETKVARDALAVYVNERSPVHAITVANLAAMYTGTITSWKAVGGPDRPMVLYGREDNSGTYAYFKEHVLGGRDFASATQALAGTAAVASAVRGDELGIGYGGIAYLEGVRALAIQRTDASPPVAPSARTAADGTYPLSRDLYFYTAGAPSGTARSFVDWVTGPAGQAVVPAVGYYPLPGKS